MFMTTTGAPKKKSYMLEIVFLVQEVGVLKVTTDSHDNTQSAHKWRYYMECRLMIFSKKHQNRENKKELGHWNFSSLHVFNFLIQCY